MSDKNKNTIYIPAIILAVAILVFSPLTAMAQGSYIINDIAGPAITSAISSVLSLAFSAVVDIMTFLGKGIQANININVVDVPVVDSSWGVIRNFANMLFIVGLIIMAFGTIFNIRGYEFRSLIANFIIAALLINFSLAIGELIMKIAYSISYVFITAIGDVGDRIAAQAQFGNLFKPAIDDVKNADAIVFQATIGQVVNLIFSFIALFSLGVLWVFTFIRIPVLWALLIVSPIAWVTYILPTTRNVNRMWWKYFLGWNVFLPVYLFFVYFGLFFMQTLRPILVNITNSSDSVVSAGMQTLFIYAFMAIFLIGGAKIAMSAGMSAGAGGVAAGIWARGRAAARFTGVNLARRTPGIRQVEPAFKASQQWFDQVQRRSKEGLEKRTDIWAKGLGVEGKNMQIFNKNIENHTKQLRDKGFYDKKDALITEMSGNDPARVIAAGKLLKEFHVDEYDKDSIIKIFNAYKSVSVAEGSKFLAGLNYDKISSDNLEALRNADEFKSIPYRPEFLARITDAQIKKGRYKDANDYGKLLKTYTKEDDVLDALKKTDKDFLDSLSKKENEELFSSFGQMPNVQKFIADRMLKKGHFSPDKLKQIFDPKTGLYATDLERNRALKLAEERRLMSVLRVRKELGLFEKDENGNPKTYEEMLRSRVSRFGTEDLTKLALDPTELGDGKIEELLAALKAVYEKNPKKINAIIMSKDYTEQHAEIYGKMFDSIMDEVAAQRKEKLNIRKKGNNDDNNNPPTGGGTPPATPPSGPKSSGGSTVTFRNNQTPQNESNESRVGGGTSSPLPMGGSMVIGGPNNERERLYQINKALEENLEMVKKELEDNKNELNVVEQRVKNEQANGTITDATLQIAEQAKKKVQELEKEMGDLLEKIKNNKS